MITRDDVSNAISRFRNGVGFIYAILFAYTDVQIIQEQEVPCSCRYDIPTRTLRISLSEQIQPDEVSFHLIHETLHLLNMHLFRKGVKIAAKRNKKITDLICDAHTNTIILNDFSNIIHNEVTFLEIEKFAEQVGADWKYDKSKLYQSIEEWIEELDWLYKLNDEQQDNQPNAGSHDFDGDDNGDKNSQDGVGEEFVQKSLEGLMTEAEEASKQMTEGKGSDIYNRLINTLRKKKKVIKVPAIMAGIKEINKITESSTYTKFNSLSESYGYLKKKFIEKPNPRVLFAVDVSGSITDEILQTLYRAASKIDAEVDLVYWSDSTVPESNFYKNWTIKTKTSIYSSGGTDIGSLYEFIRTHYTEKENIFLCLATDMEFTDKNIPTNVKGMYIFATQDWQTNTNRLSFYENRFKPKLFKTYTIIDEE